MRKMGYKAEGQIRFHVCPTRTRTFRDYIQHRLTEINVYIEIYEIEKKT